MTVGLGTEFLIGRTLLVDDKVVPHLVQDLYLNVSLDETRVVTRPTSSCVSLVFCWSSVRRSLLTPTSIPLFIQSDSFSPTHISSIKEGDKDVV